MGRFFGLGSADRRPMKRALSLLLLAALLGALTSLGLAAYPERPVKMIVPWAAGGDTDAITRVFTEIARKYFPEPLVVINIPGGSGTAGAREAKASPPDGYTIYSIHDSLHITYHTGVSDVGYRDFEPICLATVTPSILAASPASPWKSFQELVEDSRKRPGEIRVGATLSSPSHLFPAMVEREAGVKWRYVGYEGTGLRITALMGNHIDLAAATLARLDRARAGKMKFLAIATEKRHPVVPDLPTLKELGINVTYAVHRGFVAPKGTPGAALARLEELCAKVTSDPAFTGAVARLGTEVRFLDGKAYGDFLERQDALNAELAKSLGHARRQ